MSSLSSFELHWYSVPMTILIDAVLSTTLPKAFTPDLSTGRSTILTNPVYSKLASNLGERFQQWDVLSFLEEAIELLRVALTFCFHYHIDQSHSLHNLAKGLDTRFQHRAIQSDLDETIELHRAAPTLTKSEHDSLEDLASNLKIRFRQQGAMSDLDEIIELHRVVIELCPQPCHINNLAGSLTNRFRQRSVLSDLSEAIELNRACAAAALSRRRS
ncbi:hypothetical protein DFH29DRAFT_1076594 [Suillus ampliporus]|nr:hypothetical protein DFH29DRAFT_1076594 [Suillus ampliporus]